MDEVEHRRIVQLFNVKNDLGGKLRFRSGFRELFCNISV